jgi:hypothetical protein
MISNLACVRKYHQQKDTTTELNTHKADKNDILDNYYARFHRTFWKYAEKQIPCTAVRLFRYSE